MVNTRSEIRAINRGYKRAREVNAAVRAAPVMALPAEIRAMIYSQLAPIDRLRINCCDSLTAAFNPYKQYDLVLSDEILDQIIIAIYIDLGLLPALCANPQFATQYSDYLKEHSLAAFRPSKNTKCAYCKCAAHNIIVNQYVHFWTPRYIEGTNTYMFATKFVLQWLRRIKPLNKCKQIIYNVCATYRLLLYAIIHFAGYYGTYGEFSQVNRTNISTQYLAIFEEYYINNPIIPFDEIIAFHQDNPIHAYSMIIQIPTQISSTATNYNIICKLLKYYVPYITQLDKIIVNWYDPLLLNMVYNETNIVRLINDGSLNNCDRVAITRKIKSVNPAILYNSVIRQFLRY